MKDVGIGFWGLGMIGKTHLESLRLMQVMFPELPKVTAQALCTRTVEGYKQLLFTKVSDNAKDMLEDEQVTLIDILSPNYAHFEQARAALLHHKNVYIEKPVALNLAEAKDLVELAESLNAVNRVALVYRFVPAVAAMRDRVHSGDIGEIIHFNMRFYHHSYLDPDRPTSWRQQAKLSGGGSMIDLGIHFTDIIHWLFGDIDCVNAMQRTVIHERYTDKNKSEKIPNDTEEWCSAQIRMRSGVCGTLESSRVSAHVDSGTTIEVYGTKGSFRFDVACPAVLFRFSTAAGRVETITKFSDCGEYSAFLSKMIPPSRDDAGFFLNAHIASLKGAIEADAGHDKNPCPVTFREAYEAQRIVTMIMSAAATGKTVYTNEFPPLENPADKS